MKSVMSCASIGSDGRIWVKAKHCRDGRIGRYGRAAMRRAPTGKTALPDTSTISGTHGALKPHQTPPGLLNQALKIFRPTIVEAVKVAAMQIAPTV